MEGHTEPHQGVANEPSALYPPRPVLERLTAPTPGVRHALHRASVLTEQLNDEVVDLALQPLGVLCPQTHIPPAGTSNGLGRLGLQRRVEAAHPGSVVEQWLTLRNPSAVQGHWYLHQLPLLPRTAPEHRRQNPYHTHLERRGAQGFTQPVPPALSPGQGPEALQQGPPLDTATTVQQTGNNGADGAEVDVTNCSAVAWTAACRHLARDTTRLNLVQKPCLWNGLSRQKTIHLNGGEINPFRQTEALLGNFLRRQGIIAGPSITHYPQKIHSRGWTMSWAEVKKRRRPFGIPEPATTKPCYGSRSLI